MSSLLDDALAKLDEVLQEQTIAAGAATPEAPEEEPQPEQEPAERSPARCQALTKAGARCMNRPLPGSRFCHVHQPE
jgi:hypothetical protein